MRKALLTTGGVLLALGISLPLAVGVHKLVWNFTHQPEIIARWGKAPFEWLITNPFFAFADPSGYDWYYGAAFVGLLLGVVGTALALLGDRLTDEPHDRYTYKRVLFPTRSGQMFGKIKKVKVYERRPD